MNTLQNCFYWFTIRNCQAIYYACIKFAWDLPKVEPEIMEILTTHDPRSDNKIWDKYEVMKWDYEVWNMK